MEGYSTLVSVSQEMPGEPRGAVRHLWQMNMGQVRELLASPGGTGRFEKLKHSNRHHGIRGCK